MIDRVDKVGAPEPWRVKASKKASKDKKRQQDTSDSDDQQQRNNFEESSDFIQLLTKDPRKFKSTQLDTGRITALTYRGISTHREKAILEVDIAMQDGTLLHGAQLALSRQEGLLYISKAPGDNLAMDHLIQGSAITVALPEDNKSRSTLHLKKEGLEDTLLIKQKNSLHLNLFYVLGYGAMFIALILLIYLLFAS